MRAKKQGFEARKGGENHKTHGLGQRPNSRAARPCSARRPGKAIHAFPLKGADMPGHVG
jgi:hypothetical protein